MLPPFLHSIQFSGFIELVAIERQWSKLCIRSSTSLSLSFSTTRSTSRRTSSPQFIPNNKNEICRYKRSVHGTSDVFVALLKNLLRFNVFFKDKVGQKRHVHHFGQKSPWVDSEEGWEVFSPAEATLLSMPFEAHEAEEKEYYISNIRIFTIQACIFLKSVKSFTPL